MHLLHPLADLPAHARLADLHNGVEIVGLERVHEILEHAEVDLEGEVFLIVNRGDEGLGFFSNEGGSKVPGEETRAVFFQEADKAFLTNGFH